MVFYYATGAGAGWRATFGRRFRFWRADINHGLIAPVGMDAMPPVRYPDISLTGMGDGAIQAVIWVGL